jgi:hypothetical protein
MVTPLSTTFVHILRLNRLLSTRKFQVDFPVRDSRCKTRNVAVNQKGDHYGWCLDKWFAANEIRTFPRIFFEIDLMFVH